jgi:hypothetical protein
VGLQIIPQISFGYQLPDILPGIKAAVTTHVTTARNPHLFGMILLSIVGGGLGSSLQ